MTFADDQVTFVDLSGETWGSFRLVVGGKDVTVWRGTPAQIAGFQLLEPYTFGDADFSLPQLSMFEVDQWGTGDLAWFNGEGTPVRLKQVDGDGTVVRTVWRGFVGLVTVSAEGTHLHCEGDAIGRLENRNHHPDLFALKRHVGRKIYNAFEYCRLNLTPHLGGDYGVQTSWRGEPSSKLDYVDSLLALTIDTDGSQYTIRAQDDGGYILQLKDTTTVDYTVFAGAHGVDLEVSRDISERVTAVYGSGVAPNGLVWCNAKAPNLKQGDAPDYPMDDNSSFGEGTTDADTDSGDGVTVMIFKLVGAGYLDRIDKPGGFDSDVTEALKELQDDAGLTQSGNMTVNTWNALWDLDVSGTTLLQAYVAPLAEASKVRKWNRTANGARASLNPDYDPSVIPVDLSVDHGASVEKKRAVRYSRGVKHRAQTGKQWAGQLTLTTDVFEGDCAYDDVDLASKARSRLDVREGSNIKVVNFDGDTLFHVGGVDFSVNESAGVVANLAIDTQARDAATLGEVIARNVEAKTNARRTWKRQHRAGVNFRQVEFSEIGGVLWNKVELTGNAWNVVEIPVGQAGSVSRIRIKTENDAAEFVAAVTAQKTSRSFWRGMVGNPFRGSGVAGIHVSDGGSGYTGTPTVSITGGGGSGATAVAHVGSTNTVTEIVLTDRGSGYTSAPTISLSGGGGSGATAHADVVLNDPWTTGKFQKFIDKQRSLLGAWGNADQPCGYSPRAHTEMEVNGTLGKSDAPITGIFVDDGGFDYHTWDHAVLYLAIYPDRDCVIKPQRILWSVESSSAG